MPSVKESNEWLEWLRAIIVALIIVFFLRTFVFATSIVVGESMDPTLENGERVIVNKAVYIVGEPERGDIVIIRRPAKNYVKRVIAEPGETIEMRNHTLYIDGEKYSQSFLDEEAIRHTSDFGPTDVPEENYFVMGDNRAVSKDSRNGLGFIEGDNIIGRSEFVIFPIDHWSMTR